MMGRGVARLAALCVVVVVGIVGATASPVAALVSAEADATAMANGQVAAIVQTGNRIFIGGAFTAVGTNPAAFVARSNLAALNAITGQLDPTFNLPVNGEVRAMAVSPDGASLIIGGTFTRVGTQRRNRLAKIDLATGTLTAWNPGASAVVRALAVSSTRVYAGGAFGVVGGLPIVSLAAIDLATGVVDPRWTPTPNQAPRAIHLSSDGSTLVVGGAFTAIGGQLRRNLASVSTVTGLATGWVPEPNYRIWVLDLSTDGTTVFTGSDTNRVTAFPLTAGAARPRWTSRGNGNVQAIGASAETVYVGGHFTTWTDQHRGHLAALSTADGSLTAWTPTADSDYGVGAMAVTDSSVMIGGDFGRVNWRVQARFARFSGTP